MPIYDYRCTVCKAEFERTMPMSAAGKAIPCKHCAAVAVPMIRAAGLKADGAYSFNDGKSQP